MIKLKNTFCVWCTIITAIFSLSSAIYLILLTVLFKQFSNRDQKSHHAVHNITTTICHSGWHSVSFAMARADKSCRYHSILEVLFGNAQCMEEHKVSSLKINIIWIHFLFLRDCFQEWLPWLVRVILFTKFIIYHNIYHICMQSLCFFFIKSSIMSVIYYVIYMPTFF